MLTQNHVTIVKGFMGQTTGFNRDNIKKHVLIMGEDTTTPQVKYLHGNLGQGTFTFLGGHDQRIISILWAILKQIFLFTKILPDIALS